VDTRWSHWWWRLWRRR
jgi:hypothetical protein